MRICFLWLIACILSLAVFSIAHAQSERWTIITSSHDTLQFCTIGSLEGVAVTFNCKNSLIHISVDSVESLSKNHNSRLWSNIGIGAIAGCATGAFFIGPSLKFGTQDAGSAILIGALLGAGAGSIAGGIYNLASSDTEVFHLSGKTTEDKIKIIRELRRLDR
ncbi:MAG: hypothetical protein HY964_09895 [Ignavibacteriales bacterium]|nr:hypothetical protein [Ignavibacteriales bacterium]